MIVVKDKAKLDISDKASLVALRRKIVSFADQTDMNVMSQQAFITAAIELATNIIKYAEQGIVSIEVVHDQGKRGLRAYFEDDGPGIEDIEKALESGFSSSKSLGLGLSGVKKLVDLFEISSSPGNGTKVEIVKWR